MFIENSMSIKNIVKDFDTEVILKEVIRKSMIESNIHNEAIFNILLLKSKGYHGIKQEIDFSIPDKILESLEETDYKRFVKTKYAKKIAEKIVEDLNIKPEEVYLLLISIPEVSECRRPMEEKMECKVRFYFSKFEI